MKMKENSKIAISEVSALSREAYEANLRLLEIELVKLQKHFISCGDRILVIVAGNREAVPCACNFHQESQSAGIRERVGYGGPRAP